MALVSCLVGWLNYQPKNVLREIKISEVIQKGIQRLRVIGMHDWICHARPPQFITSLYLLWKSPEEMYFHQGYEEFI